MEMFFELKMIIFKLESNGDKVMSYIQKRCEDMNTTCSGAQLLAHGTDLPIQSKTSENLRLDSLRIWQIYHNSSCHIIILEHI